MWCNRMSTIITIENLGKKYFLRHQSGQQPYVALRDVLADTCKTFGRRLAAPFLDGSQSTGSGPQSPTSEEFWALKDLSFEVKQGDRIGIIGRNGAGKSTLLKILSRITEPTTGSVRIRGRVASLLEVGTGFHPELTGRENVFLNGAILGMGQAEIKKKFDEIVAFAEVEKFLDTPVKRYSSGMYVRLAFAVAAHLEPEILVVDEVLAVGDAQFQKKCLGKMEDVSTKEGRTVLFVSHNMAAITSLCRIGILLDSGRITAMGKTSDVVLSYYSHGTASPSAFNYSDTDRKIGDSCANLVSGAVLDKNNNLCAEVDIREPFCIVMQYCITDANYGSLYPNFHFYYADGSCAFVSSHATIADLPVGVYEVTCSIPGNLLNEGTYFVGLALTSLESGVRVHFHAQNALSFNVKDPIDNVPTRNSAYSGPVPGVLRPLLDWSVRSIA
jgi:lipopolysaccharide transport system ATP-binding protein